MPPVFDPKLHSLRSVEDAARRYTPDAPDLNSANLWDKRGAGDSPHSFVNSARLREALQGDVARELSDRRLELRPGGAFRSIDGAQQQVVHVVEQRPGAERSAPIESFVVPADSHRQWVSDREALNGSARHFMQLEKTVEDWSRVHAERTARAQPTATLRPEVLARYSDRDLRVMHDALQRGDATRDTAKSAVSQLLRREIERRGGAVSGAPDVAGRPLSDDILSTPPVGLGRRSANSSNFEPIDYSPNTKVERELLTVHAEAERNGRFIVKGDAIRADKIPVDERVTVDGKPYDGIYRSFEIVTPEGKAVGTIYASERGYTEADIIARDEFVVGRLGEHMALKSRTDRWIEKFREYTEKAGELPLTLNDRHSAKLSVGELKEMRQEVVNGDSILSAEQRERFAQLLDKAVADRTP